MGKFEKYFLWVKAWLKLKENNKKYLNFYEKPNLKVCYIFIQKFLEFVFLFTNEKTIYKTIKNETKNKMLEDFRSINSMKSPECMPQFFLNKINWTASILKKKIKKILPLSHSVIAFKNIETKKFKFLSQVKPKSMQ